MKKHAFAFIFSAQFFLGGCASNSGQLGEHTPLPEQRQQSNLNGGSAVSSKNSDAGITVRDTVDTVQDITQNAREAKSTAYELKQTINELKGLMEGW
ncbi:MULTISPECIES: hypothetical protein [Pseudomonadaceae]|uniref:hypothetical protein n=1 Tax=Pseudomonadaceae TaxID=135621 RepID=UPI001AEFA01B|nr:MULTISPECIES: hypothetical protein [Pseudomonas]QTS88916.1 hypothetical protein JLK41_12535 [Pseudomonas khazarica]